MKNLIFFLFLCSLISCSTTPTDNNDQENSSEVENSSTNVQNDSISPSIPDVIPLDTFHLWVNNWDSLSSTWLDTATLTAFNMPLIDLGEVLGETGAKTSRFYLGLKTEGSGYKAKLTVLGVNGLNEDMIDYANGLYVYDVSEPCPPICRKIKKK